MDLKQMFGYRYLITLDESWEAETPENRAEFRAQGEEWWYWQIEGRRGTIYPFNASTIAVDVTPRRARRLEALLGAALTLHTRCDEVVAYKADVQHIKVILRFIKPKRPWQFTAEQKAALATRLAANRSIPPVRSRRMASLPKTTGREDQSPKASQTLRTSKPSGSSFQASEPYKNPSDLNNPGMERSGIF